MIKSILRFVKSTPNLRKRVNNAKVKEEIPLLPTIIITSPDNNVKQFDDTTYKPEDPQIFLNKLVSHLYFQHTE